ncbi:MAG: hypothetical protein COB67_09440, partial [SAR324 cluster bacterium]
KIFDKFSQGDISTTRRFGGTGLGLAICKRLIEMMGGMITVKSELGRGASFHFDLTLPLSAGSMRQQQLLDKFGKELKVLIVDNSSVNCEILQKYLHHDGLFSDTCASAQVALEMMSTAFERKVPYDFVLIDHLLPGTDGLELGLSIRTYKEFNDSKLIILSSTNSLDCTQLKGIGFYNYLYKPVSQIQLSNALRYP